LDLDLLGFGSGPERLAYCQQTPPLTTPTVIIDHIGPAEPLPGAEVRRGRRHGG